MNTQTRTTFSFGSGKTGAERAQAWKRAAREMGYAGVGPMALEMVDWILAHAVWKQGQGIVGFRKVENSKT